MADNSTWAGMIALGLSYHVYCEPCGRSAALDMTKLPPNEQAIGRTFRCSQCGRPGHTIVSNKSAERSYPGARPN